MSAEFVWRLEAILAVSAEPYAPREPGVCVDERPDPLVSEVRQPLPRAPGRPVRDDDDYRREGTCHLCMCLQPLQGWRPVQVTARRTAQDFAHGRQALVAHHCPKAQVLRVVWANLTPHTPAALYATFAPAEARRVRCKLA